VEAGGGGDDLIGGVFVRLAILEEVSGETGGIDDDFGRKGKNFDFAGWECDLLEPLLARHVENDLSGRFFASELKKGDGTQVDWLWAPDNFACARRQEFRCQKGVDPGAGIE